MESLTLGCTLCEGVLLETHPVFCLGRGIVGRFCSLRLLERRLLG